MVTKTAIMLGVVIGIFFLYFLLSPSLVDPAPYQPPAAPAMAGPFAVNDKLKTTEIIAKGKIHGPEDVDQSPDGFIVAGLSNGDIVRIGQQEKVEVITNTGGRPLGLHYAANGNLIIADAKRGLLQMAPDGTLELLADHAESGTFGFTDDLDIAADGKIYFSDASWLWPIEQYRLDAIEAKPYGRLLRYDPATGITEELLNNLYLANGVALSQNEDFVLVNETFRYRIKRYWLQGPKKGTADIFADNLPGFPDGISANRQGTFWVALAAPRNTQLDSMHPYPWLKKLVVKLPEFLQPQPVHYGFVLGFDESGEVVENLQDPSGEQIYEITSVEQVGNALLLGSLTGDRIGRYRLKAE